MMKNVFCVAALLASPALTPAGESEPNSLPRPLELVGLHAYADKILCAGETIHFRVSSTVPYELSVCRLGQQVDDPAGDEVLFTFPKSPPVAQPIHPGSFVFVEKAFPADQPLEALTLECWVRPWRLNSWQTLISQYDYPSACGFGLFIDADGKLQFYLGDGAAYRKELAGVGPQLEVRRWYHVVATWDGKTKSLWLDGELAEQWPFERPARVPNAPLRLGSCGQDGSAVNILDGDLAMPVIYGRMLTADEIAKRYDGKGLEPAHGEDVLACWPLGEERGDRIEDVSGSERHGRIVNEATWMIGGPSFDGSKVSRYGDYDPATDVTRGHGLRFASDDLYDCRWNVTHEYRIPKTAKPGHYVGRFRFEIDGVPRLYDATFVVKKAEDQPKAPILVIASTNSWLAYMATAFLVTPPGLLYHCGTGGITNSPVYPPIFCLDRNHQGGLPAY
ncbi:MAG: LamG domain-containing protein, partial [Planctomycetes bacterium]|nr:LamG domain-containing protein [Planctomycetota bacterium]